MPGSSIHRCTIIFAIKLHTSKLVPTMKGAFITLLMFLSIYGHGQRVSHLDALVKSDSLGLNESIIYGNFIQRLGFASGGYPQDIRLLNLDTQQVLAFRVKPTMKSAKENTFAYFIPAGNYAILNYWWTRSSAISITYTEPIFKDVNSYLILEKNRGRMNTENLTRFTFTIAPNSINYMGTWHFNTGLVSFTDDKAKMDKVVQPKYKRIDFEKATVVLPQ
jgi:hypothetical protein